MQAPCWGCTPWRGCCCPLWDAPCCCWPLDLLLDSESLGSTGIATCIKAFFIGCISRYKECGSSFGSLSSYLSLSLLFLKTFCGRRDREFWSMGPLLRRRLESRSERWPPPSRPEIVLSSKYHKSRDPVWAWNCCHSTRANCCVKTGICVSCLVKGCVGIWIQTFQSKINKKY